MPPNAHGVVARLAPFGSTIFTEMSRLAAEHGAINLAQGFPDFDGPEFLKDAAIDAVRAGHGQYARMFGLPALNEAIATEWKLRTGLEADPTREVTVTSGCTEAIAATLLGLIEPGDEVVLFEPFYDSYRACVAMAGGIPRFVTLRPPGGAVSGGGVTRGAFAFDERELRAAFGPRTKAILVNTPHNPTGKVFTREELSLIARMCEEHDAIAITDEVYERLVYDGAEHVSLASLPGMAARTVTLNSLGKTFSLTGWKIGWAIAPPNLTAGVRAAHQFLTFATSTPMQHAAARAIGSAEADAYSRGLVATFAERRSYLLGALAALGFTAYAPAGAYFIMADHSAFGRADDADFARWLTSEIGVAAIPPGGFYSDPARGRSLARFAFCKRQETLAEAVRRMQSLRRR